MINKILVIPFMLYAPLVATSFVFRENNVLEIFNLLSVNSAFVHFSYILSRLDVFVRINYMSDLLNICYLYERNLRNLIFNISFIIFSVLYQFIVFDQYICQDYCPNLNKLMRSIYVVTGINGIVNSVVFAFYIISYVYARRKIWIDIIKKENLLKCNSITASCFNIDGVAEENSSHFITKSFIKRWKNLSNASLLTYSCENAKIMYDHIYKQIDTNNDDKIDYSEYMKFVDHYKIPIDSSDFLWQIMSEEKCNYIDKDSILRCITNLNLERRKFANMMYTDSIVVVWIQIYLSIVMHGLGIIFILNICNYSQAFGTGTDLFKIYLVCLTYLIGVLKQQINFIITMVRIRPFNIGDLIIFKDDPCIVSSLTTLATELDGAHKYCITNTNLINSTIENLSESLINDCYSISIPFTFKNSIAEVSDMIQQCINENRDTRCGSITITQCTGSSMTFTIYWSYKINMFDRSEYLTVRTKVINKIILGIKDKLCDSWIAFNSAQGGAYNDKLKNE